MRRFMKRLKMFWGLQCGNPCLLNQFAMRGSAPLENRGIASKQMPTQRRHTGLCPQVCCHCAVHYSSEMVPGFSLTVSHRLCQCFQDNCGPYVMQVAR